jgi:hypothetical protein
MSWLFSQVLVEEYLGDTCLDGEPSALLSGNSTQQAYCAQDKMTDFSRLSRFGMTYKPLTESRGEELLMLYRAGFHAKTSLPLEKEQELTENDQECGGRWQGLLARYDPSTHSLRTVQCSLLEDLNESLQTWPKWGSMRNGECFQQPMLEQTISENEFGSLEKIPNNLDFFHTPNTTGLDGGSNSRKALKKRMEQWPTPDANCGQRGTQPNWTPKRKSGHSAQYTINQAVRDKFPTPTAHNSKEGAYPAEFTRKTPTLATHAGGKLNPMWVEWLMGWPLGWTDLKQLETDKCHFVQQQPGTFLKED